MVDGQWEHGAGLCPGPRVSPSKFFPSRRTNRLTHPESKRGRFTNFVSAMRITRSFRKGGRYPSQALGGVPGFCLEIFVILRGTRFREELFWQLLRQTHIFFRRDGGS